MRTQETYIVVIKNEDTYVLASGRMFLSRRDAELYADGMGQSGVEAVVVPGDFINLRIEQDSSIRTKTTTKLNAITPAEFKPMTVKAASTQYSYTAGERDTMFEGDRITDVEDLIDVSESDRITSVY